ncbi:hypothetical protein SALBM311S_06127 [Streptomyces alboniger]
MSASRLSRSQDRATPASFPDSDVGSYDGLDTSARIRPLDGSIAATAPLRPASPRYAARCAARSRVVTTSPPGFRARVTSFHSGNGDSIGSAPDRTPSCVCSRRLVPYSCEAKPVTGANIGPSVYVRSARSCSPVSRDPVTGRPPTRMSPRGWP